MKIITRATFTLNPLRLVIEQTESHSSSSFPAAEPYVETSGEDASEQSQFRPRPIVKCGAVTRARKAV